MILMRFSWVCETRLAVPFLSLDIFFFLLFFSRWISFYLMMFHGILTSRPRILCTWVAKGTKCSGWLACSPSISNQDGQHNRLRRNILSRARFEGYLHLRDLR